MPAIDADSLLVRRIRSADEAAWRELIDRFEGRLLAFVRPRLGDRAAAEDVVQEVFIGFLVSLPNFDERRPLEGFLFSVARHKLTDRLRREGRRPALPLLAHGGNSSDEPAGRGRPASAALRSAERRSLEEPAVAAALGELAARLRQKEQWQKLACLELLVGCGWPNKRIAAELGLTEQVVANWKHEWIGQLRGALAAQRLSADVFPELAER